MSNERNGLELRSTIAPEGRLTLALVPSQVRRPLWDEVTVQMEAAPINPSDSGLLLGPVDMSTLERDGDTLVGSIPAAALPSIASRIGDSVTPGNEGAGTVVDAGASARHLLGRTVGVHGGGMYTRFRTIPAANCLVLPDEVTSEQGAASFVNPMTVLAIAHTARTRGHSAIVHTAAASNLGRMLNRLCIMDGTPLVNIVRDFSQAELLKSEGATHVVDSSAENFEAALEDAITTTSATVAFDAVGGGTLANEILKAMEAAALRREGAAFSRYGSSVHKQIFVYGSLDPRPTMLDRSVGTAWGVEGFLLTTVLATLESEKVETMRARVARELTTTFASAYSQTIGLSEMLDPDTVREFSSKSTGRKFLVDPQR